MSDASERSEKRNRRRGNGEGGMRWDEPRQRWIGTLTIGWREVPDGNGGVKRKQIRKAVTGKTKKDVTAKMREWQGMLDAGKPVPDQRITVGAMLDIWLSDVLPGTVSRVTEGQYRDVVRLYLKPRIGECRLRDLTPTDVTRMLRDMEQPAPGRPNGYSENSRRLARSVLRRALRWAEVEGLVSRNVAALSNPVRVERPDARTMTPDEARAFLDAARGDRLEALYVVALSLGLRISELLGLGWDDLVLDPTDGGRATMTVRRGLKRLRGGGLVIEGVKTKMSRRTIHMPDVSVDALRVHRARQLAEQRAFVGEWPRLPLGVDLVFRTVIGTALDPSNVAHALVTITRRAGLGHWSPHDLRHSAASLLAAQGVPLKMVSDILGHSSITVTADIYSHMYAPARDDAAAAMDRALRGAPPVFDRESLDANAEHGRAPTAEEVTTGVDPTRFGSPDRIRRFAAKLLMERAGVSELVDPAVFGSDERFDAWVTEFNRTHPAGA